MANAASNEIISLPKGGGAMHGIGEKFSPDLHTGTGNFAVPIALPLGRNGFQPQLNLVYSTGNGNGPFGLGWSLSIPGVSRKTSKGIPVYNDAKDVFNLSGAEDLVPVEYPVEGLTRYQPRTEGLFARILHHRDPNNDYWEVRSKDGLTSRYGTERPPGTNQDWHDPARIADPENPDHIFAWKLTCTTDPFGNRIEYRYDRDSIQTDGPHHWDQLYLREIAYVDHGDRDSPKFLVKVRFVYEDRPDDPFSEYRAGFEIRTIRRCTRIEIYTDADQERLIRTYRLIYLDQREELRDRLPINGFSLLSEIRVIGHEGEHTEELPPLEFNYTSFKPEQRKYSPFIGQSPASSLGNPNLELVDLFGNGLPDILEMSGTVRYWRNLGGGKFDSPRMMQEAPAESLAEAGVQLIDANGDGRSDLLVTRDGRAGYYPLTFDGRWDPKSYQPYKQAPSFNLEDPEVRLVDLDGDGITDAIRSSARLECFFNDPKKGWNKVKPFERRQLEDFPNVNFSDPRVKWADMTGDGLQDIVLIHYGRVDYWPNLGHGEWGKRITMRNSPRFEDAGIYGPIGYDPKRILLGDVDGDGVADLVYIGSGHITVWINQSGNGWSEPIPIRGTPTITDLDAVRLADIYGTGTTGILWTYDYGVHRDSAYKFLDLTGGVKPYLLNMMDNHIGAVTKVEYASSTHFYLQDQTNRDLKKRWETPLPFPVQVVSRVEVVDKLSKGRLTTEYRYHHGYWDGAEREFRGFGMVEQLDTESFEKQESVGLQEEATFFQKVDREYFSPPLLTKTWFHQGPVGEDSGDWQELDWSDEYWFGDPQLLKHTETVDEFLKGLTERRFKRDALRALRGSVLRTELYALDGSPLKESLEEFPYTVTENAYGLREESKPGSGEKDRLHIFFPFKLASRTTQWERGNDPMTQFSFTDDYNEYGQPQRQTQIACPRGWKMPDDRPDASYLATRTRTFYAKPNNSAAYIHDRVAKTATYEILNTTDKRLSEIITIEDNNPDIKIIGLTLNYYDEDTKDAGRLAFMGLPSGQVGLYGALVRTESLVLTEAILQDAYRSGDDLKSPPEEPPYFNRNGVPQWTNDYPQAFREAISEVAETAGYVFHPGGPDSLHMRGFFVQTERRRYDFHDNPLTARGLVTVIRDPLGYDATIEYDEYRFLPSKVTNPAGLTTEAIYDYRVLQPRQVTDPNDNTTLFTFSPLGLLASSFVRGKTTSEGDQSRPNVLMEYGFLAFDQSPPAKREPIFVRTIRHIHHDTETDVENPERDQTITTVEYSDGFGRLLQTRTQGEELRFGHALFGGRVLPLDQADEVASKQEVKSEQNTSLVKPNVVVSGWQRYDNKGRVVEKYEPFFSEGWAYAQPEEAKNGQKATMFYDSRGRVFRTVNPDGSEQRVVYGVPGKIGEPNLSDPAHFEPTPWETYTYDANDNAGRTHSSTSTSYRNHWNTPASIEVDALGRSIKAIERNGPDPKIDWYITRSSYDIRGNLLTIIDPLGREAFQHAYDLANRPWRVESIDAGVKRSVLDAAGNVIEQRDSKGALILHAYDKLNRPTHLWAQNGKDLKVTLREKLIYGDASDAGLSEDEQQADNLKGKPYRHYDEAGLLTFSSYDFKGNLLEKSRRVIADSAILAAIGSNSGSAEGFIVNWDEPPTLEDEYQTSMAYDALNRIKTLDYPHDVDGSRKRLEPDYNRAGALERVTLDGEAYVERIAYNAKGQRTLIAYGNGVMTRYAYDPETFRLVRLRTERYQAIVPTVNLPRVTKFATASASSTYAGSNPASAVIDGNRAGSKFPPYWADNTRDAYPDWIEVEFDGPKTINVINVFTIQDAVPDGSPAPVEPTEELTFSKYGIRDFEVQYWRGSDWVTVPGGKVTGNDKVWRKFSFPDITADRIRVLVHRAGLGFSTVAEIEAFERGTGINVALATNGAQAHASSVLEPFPPRMVMDGDRIVYQWKGQANYPAWLKIDFGMQKTIEAIDLFFHQEVEHPMVDPTMNPDLTSRYVMTDFEVQYWTGTDWVTVPDGNVTGNDKVWRQFSFPAIATDQIRVLIHRGAVVGGVPTIIEFEAYGPGSVEFKPQRAPLQDFAYSYDLAGNIRAIQDRTKGCGVRNNPDASGVADPDLAAQLVSGDALIRRFTYDPIYRLLSATGRECKDIPFPRPWGDDQRCGFNTWNPGTPSPENAPDLTGRYMEEYRYDPAGNMITMKHGRNGNGGWTRHFGMGGLTPQDWDTAWRAHLNADGGWPKPPGNQLTHVGDNQPGILQTHFFDANGNLIRENTERQFEWDHSDRLRVFRNKTGDSVPTVHAHYLYDASGQRVKKLVRKGANDYGVTVYIDGLFEYHRRVTPSEILDNNTLHVMDNQSRIALVRVGEAFPEDGAADKPIQYHLGDYLGSSNVVIGGATAATANEFMNLEEYFPYGETSFGSFARKRYRFTGKERDEESGLYYHGARYYAPWLACWISAEPLIVDYKNYRTYAFVYNNPQIAIDPDGRHPILVIIGIAFLLDILIPNVANAPAPNSKMIPKVTEAEFLAQSTVMLATGGVGTAVGKQTIAKTGSVILGGALGGGIAGGLGAVGSVAVNDAANQQLSSPNRYIHAGREGMAIGILIGGVAGAASSSNPNASSGRSAPSPRVVNLGGELESKPGDIVINKSSTAQVPLKTIAKETRATVIEGRAEAIPLKTSSIDIVEGHNFPPNTIDWKQASQEIARVLKPGGTVDLSVRGGEAKTIAAELEKQGIKATVDPLSSNTRVTGVRLKEK